tara:strand:+ start:144 stop:356 length:213 start_codon:yes stop_codon:yes gene_type:complete
MNTNLRQTILKSLVAAEDGKIAAAKANVEIYLSNPVGIGEHPDILAAINSQIDIIAEAGERIEVITTLFE